MRVYRQFWHRFAPLLLVVTLLAVAVPVSAATSKDKAATKTTTKDAAASKPTDISNALAQSYNADNTVQTGMIVELKAKSPDTVIPLPNKEIKSMLGVVIPAANAPIVLTPATAASQQVLVTTSGQFSVLVSNEGGGIKVGDYITISAIDGVGKKASEDETQVIGKAAGDFTGAANVIGSMKLTDIVGRHTAVSIGRIPVDINISHNPLYSKTVDFVPGFLAKIALTVADHPVSVARIYLSMAIVICVSIISGNMLYSGVRSGMIAVGRNPLSKKSIIKSLIQTVFAGLTVFVVGILAVYLILKL